MRWSGQEIGPGSERQAGAPALLGLSGFIILLLTGGHLNLLDRSLFQQLVEYRLHQLEFTEDLGTRLVDNFFNREPLVVLEGNDRFKIFPSIEFESFLTLLKNCRFVIGNSSMGVREAPAYGKWAINIGSRQNNRSESNLVYTIEDKCSAIVEAIEHAISNDPPVAIRNEFGDGNSAKRFVDVLNDGRIWNASRQKQFIPIGKH